MKIIRTMVPLAMAARMLKVKRSHPAAAAPGLAAYRPTLAALVLGYCRRNPSLACAVAGGVLLAAMAGMRRRRPA